MRGKVLIIVGIAILFPIFTIIPVALFENDECWMFYSYILFFIMEGLFLPLLGAVHNVKGDSLECWNVNRTNLYTSILSLGIVILSALNGLFPFFLMSDSWVKLLNKHISSLFVYTYEGGILVSVMVIIFELMEISYASVLLTNIRKHKFEYVDKQILRKSVITIVIYIILCVSCLRFLYGVGGGHIYGDQPDYSHSSSPYDTLHRAVDAAQ